MVKVCTNYGMDIQRTGLANEYGDAFVCSILNREDPSVPHTLSITNFIRYEKQARTSPNFRSNGMHRPICLLCEYLSSR